MVTDSAVQRAEGLRLYDTELRSRLLLGTSRYPSPQVLIDAVRAARVEVVTVSLRREASGERAGQGFWSIVRNLNVRVLPNTAGCHSVKEAVTTAHMAREVFGTPWIKLEVIGEEDTLQPDVFGLVEAARVLCREGFQVFPYTTEDLVVAERLLAAGCAVLMPWGAPIGSGRGLNNLFGLRALRGHFPGVPLIIDAGIGVPSHAAQALELGFDAVLINTAVAEAGDPVQMAAAFAGAVEAGRTAHLAGPMDARDLQPAATTWSAPKGPGDGDGSRAPRGKGPPPPYGPWRAAGRRLLPSSSRAPREATRVARGRRLDRRRSVTWPRW